MRRFGLVLSAACFALAPFGATLVCAAEPSDLTVSEPTTLIDSLNADMVSKLITELGGLKVQASEADGKKIITFMDGEMPNNIGIAACDIRPGKCVALVQLVIVTTGTADVPLDMLNKYNQDGLFLTAFKLDGNKIGFGRVLLVDGGVTKLNLAANITSFGATLDDALKQLRAQLVPTAQLEKPPGTTAAAMAAAPFTAVPADVKQMGPLMNAMLAQYKATVSRRRAH